MTYLQVITKLANRRENPADIVVDEKTKLRSVDRGDFGATCG